MSLFNQFTEAFHQEMVISRTQRIGSRIQKVTLKLAFPQEPFPIGGYIQVMIGGSVPRCYTVSESANGYCVLLISFSGNGVGARFLASAPVGTALKVYGPFDDFPFRFHSNRPKVFLATGTGIAPFIRMSAAALSENQPTYIFYGARTEQDLAYQDYFLSLSEQSENFHFIPVLSNADAQWQGRKGYITHHFTEFATLLRQSDVYACGIPPMVLDTKKYLKALKIPKQQLFIQKFG